jgi:glycosidase
MIARGPRYPSLYQINTRVWLTALGRALGRAATLDDVADSELDRLAALGFDWIWLLSVWQTGAAAQRISRGHAPWRREFEDTLPDLRDGDIPGSGFAITAYTVHAGLGGDAALARLRMRMHQRGLRLMLDFVPNHVAPDHPWTDEHPGYFVHRGEADFAHAPQNHIRVATKNGPLLLAHGRDPYFDGWPDTLQLNYGHPPLQQAMSGELQRIAGQCDGLRCDMAMLVLPEVFERTWGLPAEPFWPNAIAAVRRAQPDFLFMAEVYWDMERALLAQGFDFSYDKHFYDLLRAGEAGPVRAHLGAGLDVQGHLVRFLENHDEARAAAIFAPPEHAAAAVLTYLSPGLRFFHQGQFEGRRKRISPHLGRGPDEPADAQIALFYERLLRLLRHPVLRDGQWTLLECAPVGQDHAGAQAVIASHWAHPLQEPLCVVVNYTSRRGRAVVRPPLPEGPGRTVRFEDRLAPEAFDRPVDDLLHRGLELDLPAWGVHVFAIQTLA